MSIYLFFRELNIILFEWIQKPNIIKIFYKPLTSSIFSELILYNLPDMLWFLSGLFLIRFIWFYDKKWQNIYIFCFYCLAFIFEVLQIFNMFPGTFDVMDLFLFCTGACLDGILYAYIIKRRLI